MKPVGHTRGAAAELSNGLQTVHRAPSTKAGFSSLVNLRLHGPSVLKPQPEHNPGVDVLVDELVDVDVLVDTYRL